VIQARTRSLWAGRSLALTGIVLVAVNLRTAVASLSPIVSQIRQDVPLSSLVLGILGMLPPLCYAVFGVLTPTLTRRFGLEKVLIGALVVLTAGLLGRGLATTSTFLIVASALAFAAIGVGNVVLPPLVKKYFPDRIGLLTTIYATAMATSTLLPPLIAVPIADVAGWRISLAQWGIIAAVTLIPWIALLVHPRSIARETQPEQGEPAVVNRLWGSPLAWSLAVVFSVSGLNAYALFAWLPQILTDIAGLDAVAAGALLSLYAAMGLPAALIVPILAARLGRVKSLIAVGIAGLVIGYVGLLLLPGTATWLWVALAGLGPLLFPLSLVLINLRTRTHTASVALSGFVQSIGYSIVASGPLAVGLLHEWTDGWTAPIVILLGSAIPAAIAGVVVARSSMLEDEIDRPTRLSRRRRGGARERPHR
jgi:MFS transporter, CP family, cyanate transporter